MFALQALTNPTGSVVLKSWVFFADGPASFSTDALVIDHGTATPLGWVRIEDIDADGDGDMLLIRDRADLPAAPTEIGIAENRAITGAGMMGSQGIPMMRVGTPVRGNTAFTVALTNAAPLSSVILGASRSQSQTFVTGQAGLWLNLAPSELIWPTTSFGIFSTDANGQLVVPLPIPVSVSRGEGVYGQCAVLDPAGVFTGFPFGAISLSNAVHVLIW